MLPIETPSLGYIAKSESLSLPTGKNLSTSTFNDDDDDIYTNVETLPVIQPDDLIYLTKIANAVNMFSKSECIESRGRYLVEFNSNLIKKDIVKYTF